MRRSIDMANCGLFRWVVFLREDGKCAEGRNESQDLWGNVLVRQSESRIGLLYTD